MSTCHVLNILKHSSNMVHSDSEVGPCSSDHGMIFDFNLDFNIILVLMKLPSEYGCESIQ